MHQDPFRGLFHQLDAAQIPFILLRLTETQFCLLCTVLISSLYLASQECRGVCLESPEMLRNFKSDQHFNKKSYFKQGC